MKEFTEIVKTVSPDPDSFNMAPWTLLEPGQNIDQLTHEFFINSLAASYVSPGARAQGHAEERSGHKPESQLHDAV